MPTAVITGSSRGLGRAVTTALHARGWHLVVDARHADDLSAATRDLRPNERIHPVPGDVTDPAHRRQLAATAGVTGGGDLLVNNASTLGASPLPPIAELDPETLTRVLTTNVVAPVDLIRTMLPQLLTHGGTVINVTSDAAVEPYETWGGYGSSKAALDQVSAVLAAEQPALRVYAFDPGDMRTAMHQAAFPDEDISDRPEPGSVVPALLRLLDERPPSGRYRAADLHHGATAAVSA